MQLLPRSLRMREIATGSMALCQAAEGTWGFDHRAEWGSRCKKLVG